MHRILDPDQPPVLALTDVTFGYERDAPVLANASLSVSRGEYLGVIGPNGGGKTTLIKLALGLLPVQKGKVSWFGTDVRRLKGRQRIGYVSQKATEFDSLFPVTVEEVVLMGRYALRGFMRRVSSEDREKAQEALLQVGMEDFSLKRISDLSGGQKQRVFIARALASSPEVIVLDEPTTGVDEETQTQFFSLLRDLNERKHLTLILVSHDLARIAKEASAVAVIDHEIRYYADPSEAVANEREEDFHH